MDKPQAVYNACVFSTLLYIWQQRPDGSETWTTYARQERRLNTFHLRSIRRILDIPWKVSNAEVLSRAGLPSMYTLLRQRRLRHVHRIEAGRIPKDILYRNLASGRRIPMRMSERGTRRHLTSTLRPGRTSQLSDRTRWRRTPNQHLKTGEEKLMNPGIGPPSNLE